MANYITTLQGENAELKEQVLALRESLTDLLSYLGSSKFQGFDNDWVSASEMYRRVMELRSQTTA